MSYLESLKSIVDDANQRMEYNQKHGVDLTRTFDEVWRAELYYREILFTEPITVCENKNIDTCIVGTISNVMDRYLEITVDRAQYFAFQNHMRAMAKFMQITVDRHRGMCHRFDKTFGRQPKPKYEYYILVAPAYPADFKPFVGKKVVIRYRLKPYDRRKKMCPYISVMMVEMRVQN